jgi:Omp85 superfamily domain
MAAQLLNRPRMRRLFIFLICLQFFTPGAFAQEKPTVESVEISGVADSRITTAIHDVMNTLVGQPFDQLAADEVGYKLQEELSLRIYAIRQVPGSDADHIKVVFDFVNERGFHVVWESNVNSRYTVEEVDLRGVDESAISDQLRQDMDKMVGLKLDDDQADRIRDRLAHELRPAHVVSKRVGRGADRNHVRLIYEVTKAPLFPFAKKAVDAPSTEIYIVGQSKQNFSFNLSVDFEHHNNRLDVGGINDGDALIERFAGYWLSFENIKAGTEHLGFRIEYHDYHDEWKFATQQALESTPEVPGIYRERRGVEPSLTIAANRWLRFNVGASVTELQFQYPAIHFQNANAGTASVTFQNSWNGADGDQHLTANYSIRSATHNLGSDLIYTRHLGEARYRFTTRHNEFIAFGSAGVISGAAPLFERFSLGNTSTLRGWNKYDLDPIGGNRLAYGSLEYRFTVLQLYYDVGSVWDSGTNHQTSHAIGFGLHSREGETNWFLTLGIPIRSGHIQPLKPVFMVGVR